MTQHRKSILTLLGLTLIFTLVILAMPFFGSQNLNYTDVIRHLKGFDSPDGIIFFRIRLPRILMAVITGASLSLAGLIFQALLRNPLATPYTLGVSSGGALGAVLIIKLGISFSILGFSAMQLAAFLGSLCTVLLVYYLARKQKRISVPTMILAGVTISYFFGAVILMLHFLADFTETRQMIRWMMGGLDVVDPSLIWKSLPLLLFSFAVLFRYSRMFNIISLSEDTAWSKGVNVESVQRIAFVFASFITGIVVAISGPIGFVGLIVPHFLRMILGYDHRFLIPGALVTGGIFLTVCDTVARTLLAPVDIPVGIITAIVGGPFFLWMLVNQQHRPISKGN